MKVSKIMSNRVVTVSPHTEFKTVWSTISSHHINALPVVDQKKKLVGIITKEDLLKCLYPNYLDLVDDFAKATDFDEMENRIQDFSDITARQLMNTRVVFTRAETPIMRALSRMIAQRLNQLPVLSDTDEVIGMVTKGDIFKGLFQEQVKRMKPTKRSKVLVSV